MLRLRSISRAIAVLATVPLIPLAASPAAAVSVDMDCPPIEQTVGPGESATYECVVTHDVPQDITVWYGIESYTVYDQNNNVVTGQSANTFASFFTIDAATQRILTADLAPNEADDLDVLATANFRAVCLGKQFSGLPLNDGDLDGTGCRIGRIRGLSVPPHGPTQRRFQITLHMSNEGNQTQFAGWAIGWTAKMRVAIPAVNDCPSRCTTILGPVYER